MSDIIKQTITDDGHVITTVKLTENIKREYADMLSVSMANFLTTVVHPKKPKASMEFYLYDTKPQALLHHQLLADGHFYDDEEEPNRWIQIAKDQSK